MSTRSNVSGLGIRSNVSGLGICSNVSGLSTCSNISGLGIRSNVSGACTSSICSAGPSNIIVLNGDSGSDAALCIESGDTRLQGTDGNAMSHLIMKSVWDMVERSSRDGNILEQDWLQCGPYAFALQSLVSLHLLLYLYLTCDLLKSQQMFGTALKTRVSVPTASGCSCFL